MATTDTLPISDEDVEELDGLLKDLKARAAEANDKVSRREAKRSQRVDEHGQLGLFVDRARHQNHRLQQGNHRDDDRRDAERCQNAHPAQRHLLAHEGPATQCQKG